jgi:hypothetical protein
LKIGLISIGERWDIHVSLLWQPKGESKVLMGTMLKHISVVIASESLERIMFSQFLNNPWREGS